MEDRENTDDADMSDGMQTRGEEQKDIGEGQGSRLVIKKVELENFKSYGGVQEIGPLHHSFTAIVGPNGSGKSNIIEAILFVFGKRASKLRQNRMADLIHKSEAYPNCRFARVSVYFQSVRINEEGESELVRGSEFVVSRLAYVDRAAEYQIDGRRVSVEEVYRVLRDEHGIDLDRNRFLILQGEVETISMMDRMELLEYLEEVIGSHVYVEEIERVKEELSGLSQERAQKLEWLRLAEKEKSALEGEKEKAVDCLRKMKELCDRKALGYAYKRHCAEKKAEEIEAEFDRAKEEVDTLKRGVDELGERIERLRRQYEEQSGRKQLEERMEEARRSLKKMEERDLELRDLAKKLCRNESKLRRSMEKSEEQVREREGRVEEWKLEIERLSGEVEVGEKKLRRLEERLRGERKKVSGKLLPVQQRLSSKQRDLIPLQKARVEVESQLNLKRLELEVARGAQEEVELEWRRAGEKVREMEEWLSGQSKERKRLRKELDEVVLELKKSEEKKERYRIEEGKISERVEDLRRLQAEGGGEELLTRMKEGLPDSVAREVLGRLGDLGYIEEKYELAANVSTGAWSYVVVRNAECAQRCVQELRRRRLGRATFLVLEELRVGTEGAGGAEVEGAKRLVDLIESESEEVLPAIRYACGDTWVCESLERAREVALSGGTRRRVVTTDGSLFEVHGTLTSGGRPTSWRGRGLRVKGRNRHGGGRKPEDEVADLKRLIESLSGVRDRMRRMESVESEWRSKHHNLSQELERLEIGVKNGMAQRDDEKQRESRLDSERRHLEKQKGDAAKIEKEIQHLEDQVDQISKDSSSLESEIQQIETELDRILGPDVKRLERDCEHLRGLIKSWQEDIVKNEVSIESAQRDMERHREMCAECLRSIDELNQRVVETEKELESLTNAAFEVTQQNEEAEAAYASLAEQLEKQRDELEQLESSLSSQRDSLRDSEGRLSSIDVQLKEVKTIVSHFSAKLDTLASRKLSLRFDEDDNDLELQIEHAPSMSKSDIKENDLEVNRLNEELVNVHYDQDAIVRYREKKLVFEKHRADAEETTRRWDERRQHLDTLQNQRLSQFMNGYGIINAKLKEMYRMLTSQNGSAELECSTDLFSEGISFSVRPPNKTWKNIQNLSGGEKTLSSLSLVFALHHFKPTPIYIMDEIDAALDFRNVIIIANYIKRKTKHVQFLIISLRNYMFELADCLVGIYKTENVTKTVCINPADFCIQLGAHTF
ncbi:structural maintenance of chromosomes protein 4-like [Schistocerca gregaria]|uniref:structural maintenance of chromosomes protein 4-like n=1 Tax=Schistocerca gregaria TaxID=7010 RepID=UPI00211F0119|nr:structural maintenance of chromosomes protein 4-like [Schistocerca gregaria]